MGNSKTAFSTLGASNHSIYERPNEDLYTTDRNDFRRFLNQLQEDGFLQTLPHNIIEPFAGINDMVEVLREYGFNVKPYDIIDRNNLGIEIKNFLTDDFENVEGIISNPPYFCCLQMLKRALEIVNDNGWIIFLLRIQFLESIERYYFFKNYPPKYVYICSRRLTCYRNGDTTFKQSAVAYAFFCFQKGYKGESIIRWINP
jgi:hypothetical protein